MLDDSDNRLSVEEAARLIYQTAHPDPGQINKTRYRLKRGVLKGNPAADWISERSLAQYIAARAEKQRLERQPQAGRDAELRHAGSTQQLSSTYRLGLADYFTAVLRYRRPAGASPRFVRMVLIGQIVLAAAPILIALGTWRFSGRQPREQRLVEQWIVENTEGASIVRWFPTQPSPTGTGELVRVQYRYRAGKLKTVQTERSFIVSGDTVSFYNDPDE